MFKVCFSLIKNVSLIYYSCKLSFFRLFKLNRYKIVIFLTYVGSGAGEVVRWCSLPWTLHESIHWCSSGVRSLQTGNFSLFCGIFLGSHTALCLDVRLNLFKWCVCNLLNFCILSWDSGKKGVTAEWLLKITRTIPTVLWYWYVGWLLQCWCSLFLVQRIKDYCKWVGPRQSSSRLPGMLQRARCPNEGREHICRLRRRVWIVDTHSRSKVIRRLEGERSAMRRYVL